MQANELGGQRRRLLGRIAGFVAVVVVVSFLANLSVPVTKYAKLASSLSADKETPRHAAAWARFQDDASVQQLMQEAQSKGIELQWEQPMFTDPGVDARGDDWVGVGVWGTKNDGSAVLVVGLYKGTSRQIETAALNTLKFSNNYSQLNRIDGKRLDHGVVVRQATATWDPLTGNWIGDNGEILSTTPVVTFGDNAEAFTCSDLCDVVTGVTSVFVCWGIGALTGGLGGILCGLFYVAVAFVMCQPQYVTC